MVDEAVGRGIEKKLDVIIRLLAMPMLEGKNQTQRILFLADMGLDSDEMATIVGVPKTTIAARLSEARKRVGAATKQKGGKTSDR